MCYIHACKLALLLKQCLRVSIFKQRPLCSGEALMSGMNSFASVYLPKAVTACNS